MNSSAQKTSFPILVPIDFSDATEGVIETAVRYARALGGSIRLLHVREPMPGLVSQEDLGVMPLMQPMVPLTEYSQEKRLDKLRGALGGQDIPVTTCERAGAVVHEIGEQAGEDGSHLIVLGSHGHGAVYDLLVGSVAHGVLKHATCPVLVVPVGKK